MECYRGGTITHLWEAPFDKKEGKHAWSFPCQTPSGIHRQVPVAQLALLDVRNDRYVAAQDSVYVTDGNYEDPCKPLAWRQVLV